MRDPGLLEICCDRPRNLATYGEPDVFDLAAAFTFLRLNGSPRRPGPVTGVRLMEDFAPGALTESDFAAWLRFLPPPGS